MKQTMISLKNQSDSKTLTLANYLAHFLKEKNVSSGLPKGPEEHGKQLCWVTEHLPMPSRR